MLCPASSFFLYIPDSCKYFSVFFFSSYFQSIPMLSNCLILCSSNTIPLPSGCFLFARIFEIHLPSFTPFTLYETGTFRCAYFSFHCLTVLFSVLKPIFLSRSNCLSSNELRHAFFSPSWLPISASHLPSGTPFSVTYFTGTSRSPCPR